MSLISYEINLDLNWSKKCDIVAPDIENRGVSFSITDTKNLRFSCNFVNSR